MPTFHIRRRLKRYRGRPGWYLDTSDRNAGTYCGADPTDHDRAWNDKIEAFGGWVPCQECIKNREGGEHHEKN